MSKFLRMVESNLPTEGQGEHKITAHDALVNIRTSLYELNSKFTIGTSQSENSPPEGGDAIRSAIMNINGIPKFKITVTPIEAKAPIKSEEAEDGATVGAAASVLAQDPAKKSLADQIKKGAENLVKATIPMMDLAKRRLSDSSKKI